MFDLFPAFTKITRAGLNNIPHAVLSMIRPGPGISIFPTGDGGICIGTLERQGMQQGGLAGGGGGGSVILAAFVSLNAGGDTMEVYLWAGSGWSETTTTVYKPIIFRVSEWNGATITDAAGVARTYSVTDLDAKYQRRATWTVDEVEYTEVQEITSLYEVGQKLYMKVGAEGYYVDDNNAGRHWGVNEDYT